MKSTSTWRNYHHNLCSTALICKVANWKYRLRITKLNGLSNRENTNYLHESECTVFQINPSRVHCATQIMFSKNGIKIEQNPGIILVTLYF